MSDFVDSPMKPIASPPSGYGPTGKGMVNGEDGYPKRTPSPNGVDEKVRDGSLPTTKDSAFPTDGR